MRIRSDFVLWFFVVVFYVGVVIVISGYMGVGDGVLGWDML